MRPQIAGVVLVAALITVAAAGIGFAAPGSNTQAVTGPSDTLQQQQTQVQTQQQACTFPANETYESFDVSNLSAPSAVQPGETVTVTADISNPNDAPLIQCVEFRLEGDVVERRGWALNPNETETITFEVDTSGLAEGTYIHGVETRDRGELTTLDVTTEPPESSASVEFNDQTSNGSAVIVSNASLSEGGFVAIHAENGTIIGVSDYLEPGDYERLVVSLSDPLTENATLTAMPHLDTNDNQQFDFVTSNGTEDGPYTMDGEPVTDDAEVSVEMEPTTETPTTETPNETKTPTTETPTTETPNETETPTTETPTAETPNETETPTTETPNETETPTTETPNETETPTTETPNETETPTTETPTTETPDGEAMASIQFDDQSTPGVAVLVQRVSLSDGGYVVIHDESGAVLGASGYIPPGEKQNVAVTLDEPLSENATLTAMAHFDSNDNQQFDFVTSNGTEDGPYTENDEPVTDDAEVTLESEA